jgi:Fe-Mn family superoxide dismutase
MAFELPPLPYAEDALEPDYSARTISFHYGKHHKTYVDTLNKLVAGTDLEGKGLEDVIMAVAGKPDKQPVFNNAAQVWNHTFFWNCMKPGGGGAPTGPIAEKIEALGGWEKFVEDFKAAAVGRFGSGWAWLGVKDKKLVVFSTANQDSPHMDGARGVIGVDVRSASVWDQLRTQGFDLRRFCGDDVPRIRIEVVRTLLYHPSLGQIKRADPLKKSSALDLLVMFLGDQNADYDPRDANLPLCVIADGRHLNATQMTHRQKFLEVILLLCLATLKRPRQHFRERRHELGALFASEDVEIARTELAQSIHRQVEHRVDLGLPLDFRSTLCGHDPRNVLLEFARHFIDEQFHAV